MKNPQRPEPLLLEEAVEQLLKAAVPIEERRTLPLLDALGCVCARDYQAPYDQPPFDRSPLDGYAVRHRDIAAATPDSPAILTVTQEIFAGDWPEKAVLQGEAARIMTGAPIPVGADCVVRQEDTDCGEKVVRVCSAHRAHDNICDRGEDISRGMLLATAGEVLGVAQLGLLASQGIAEVEVFRRVRVGILATGDELMSPGTNLLPGKIYSSNGMLLAARSRELGYSPVQAGDGPDDPRALCACLAGLLACCDIVVTTGGVSVGQRDCLPQVAGLLGARDLFHGVAVKPGSPALALEKDGKLLLCLSGNPFAAAATFELLARPVLARISGRRNCLSPRVPAILSDPFPKPSPGRRFLRGFLRGGEVALTYGRQLSGALSALKGCNCLIDLPAGSPPMSPGDRVDVVLL